MFLFMNNKTKRCRKEINSNTVISNGTIEHYYIWYGVCFLSEKKNDKIIMWFSLCVATIIKFFLFSRGRRKKTINRRARSGVHQKVEIYCAGRKTGTTVVAHWWRRENRKRKKWKKEKTASAKIQFPTVK